MLLVARPLTIIRPARPVPANTPPDCPVKFFIRTLGCKVNQLDSARLAESLVLAQHEQVTSADLADCVIVNSCTVTSVSDHKSRQVARTAHKMGKRVVVIGCGPRVDKQRWQREFSNNTSDPSDTFGCPEVVSSDDELCAKLNVTLTNGCPSLPERTRVPILVQSGCDNACSFCITHVARGPHHSVPVENVVAHVACAVERGAKEVVLTGINLGAWGCRSSRNPEQSQLVQLLTALLDQTSVPRIRLSSLGPSYVSQSLLQLLANDRLCDHLHLSVQSGSATVLQRMARDYDSQRVIDIARAARGYRPDIALTADMIVGFPGETDRDFDQTMELARDVQFAKLHVFPYSARQGTPGAAMPEQVPAEQKRTRARLLRQLGTRSRQAFVASQMGKTVVALVQGDGTAMTTNYIALRLHEPHPEGSLVTMTICPQDVIYESEA